MTGFILLSSFFALTASVAIATSGGSEFERADLCAAVLSSPTTQDCLAQTLAPTSGGFFAPWITNNGTATGTNGAGCDGCTVSWDVTVTWNHNGQGITVVNGVRQTHTVTLGSSTTITMNAAQDIKCAAEATVEALNPGNGGASMVVRCLACN
jgi:hypothetical protein